MTEKENWYVVITKPRLEKKVAKRLESIGVEVYCPLKKEVRQWSDRKKKVEVPVLPSMVLVKLTEKSRNIVFGVAGVVRYMFWLGKPAIVRNEEIDALQKTMKSGYKVLDVERIAVGDTIQLEGMGTLKRETGTVKYVSGNHCWIVMDSLGYVVKMNI
ncbi:MAG: UpxY family transcription antiterminator [Bacteroidota bacterium]